MIKSEYETLSRLDHPLIAELQEAYVDSNNMYLVSPFYNGGELHDLIIKNDPNNDMSSFIKPISEKDLKPIVYQLLRAINFLDKNHLVHRDIKLENIMLENLR